MPLRSIKLDVAKVLIWGAAAASLSLQGMAGAQTDPVQAPQLRLEAGQHSAPIRALAIDASGQFLVTAGDDKTARIWRLQTGELLQVMRPPIGSAWEGRLYGASFSPDGATVAVAGDTGAGFGGPNRIYLFDRGNGRMKQTINAGNGPIKRLVWSRESNYLASCSAKPAEVLAFDMNGGGKKLGGVELAGDCYGLAFAGAHQLAVAHHGRRLGIYSVSGEGLRESAQTNVLSGALPSSVAYSSGRSLLAVGYTDNKTAIDIFDAPKDGKINKVKSVSGDGFAFGSLGNVTWSRDGQWLYAGGRAQANSQFILRRWETASWRAADFSVARDSVLDLAALPEGGVVFAAASGEWGTLDQAAPLTRGNSAIADLRGPGELKISADGLVVQWRFAEGATPHHFDLRERIVRAGAGKDLRGAETSSFGFLLKNWDGYLEPMLGRTALKLDPAEWSRSVALLPAKEGFILGADRSLRRYDRDGRLIWQIAPGAASYAVVPTADGERLVVACSDGSLRWYRSRDGALLLSLVPHPDRVRWVLWQPSGYYDVSPGADRMIGWHVNNGTSMAGDFYPIVQFRNLYHRTDVIDQYLKTWDIATARAQADAAITALALQPPAAPPAVIFQALPPVVDLLSPSDVRTASNKLTLRFKVRSQADAPPQRLIVRVAGVEVDLGKQLDRQKLAGGEPINLDVPLPLGPATVLVLAASKHGFSTAAVVRAEYLAPAPAPVFEAPPVTPAAPAPMPEPVLAKREEPKVAEPVSAKRPEPEKPAVAAAPKRKEAEKIPAAPPLAAIPTKPERPVASAPAGTSAAPRLFLLAIGVSEYANPEYKLGLPAKDADDFSRMVLAQRSGRLYKSVEMRVLTDKNATRKNVLDGLEWLKKNVASTDTAILFLAGHGVTQADRSYFFLTHDADLKQLEKTALSHRQITSLITGIRGQRLLFIDTCHAGNALGGRKFSSENSYLVNDLTAEENAVIVFSSSTGKQLSQENDDWGNGAFTKVVVKGAEGGADFRGTGKITQKALDYYISDEVFKLTKGAQTPLTIIPFGTPDFPLFERFN